MSPVTGRVLSVQFEGGLPAASRGAQVRPPHWEVKVASRIGDGDGSRRPAIYPTQERVRALVEVEIAGTGNGDAVGVLRGELGGLTLDGEIPLTDDRHSVRVTQAGNPGLAIARHTGDVTWVIQGPPLPEPAALDNRTRLEVFVVLGPPPDLFAKGIWAEALRLLIQQVGLNGVGDLPRAMNLITDYCHRGRGLIYDTAGKYNNFGISYNGGKFGLSTFLEGVHKEVNCYDVSVAVLVLGGAIGIPVSWLRLDSFGYIVETSLIGIGRCNHPFFAAGSRPVVGQLDPVRLPFEIHTFCESSATIFDACVGPHLGTNRRQGYLDRAVDETNPMCPKCREIPLANQIKTATRRIKGLR